MTRTLLPLALGLALTAVAPGVALATPPIDPTAVTITIGKRNSGGDIDLQSSTDQPKMFNTGHCQCATPWTVKINIAGASANNGTVNVYMYLGASCTTISTTATPNCRLIAVRRLSDWFNSYVLQDITAEEVVNPIYGGCVPYSSTGSGVTGALSGSNTFFVMIDFKGDQTFSTDTDTIQSLAINYDVQPPETVTDVKATTGENAINLSWTVPSDTDLAYMQVFCARGELPVFKQGTYSPVYQSADSVCPPDLDGGVTDAGSTSQVDAGQQDVYSYQQDAIVYTVDDGGNTTGVITGVPAIAAFMNLDPAYLCSSGLGPTATSARISGLQNGVTYYFAVVGVNTSGNASVVQTMVSATPQTVLNFWEDYKQEGGAATGCAVEHRSLHLGWAGLGLALLGLGLAVGLRRRRPRGDR